MSVTEPVVSPDTEDGALKPEQQPVTRSQRPERLNESIGIVDTTTQSPVHEPSNQLTRQQALNHKTLDHKALGHKAADYVDKASDDDASLPRLRSELVLEAVQFDKHGQPGWILQDPVKGKYFKLGWLEFELLSRWNSGNVNALIERVNSETTLRVGQGHVGSLISMLLNNELTQPVTSEDISALEARVRDAKPAAMKSAFRFTMFYRKPLVNPDQFLAALNRPLASVYRHSKALLVLWLIVAAFALNGVASHWFEFRNTFGQFMTAEGMVLFALVLVMTNIMHEIGHGLIARHYGCRVTEMGVALIFMLPVCYCDTSDVWRLADKRKRLLVNAGGLLMELVIATTACILWLVLPDGVLRTLMFFLAVTSLATTLFINLNPFMKFDGYYLLADALGVDNLQGRSFANFRWQLQTWFTGSKTEKPYRIPESSHRILNVYASATWVYRLLLYFTICWMVYEFWFKALGLVLMAGVFVTMIATPIVKESAGYASVIRNNGLNVRSALFCTSVVLLITILLVPLPRKVSAPAVLSSGYATKIFATRSAKVSAVYVNEGDNLASGQKVLSLEDPELEYTRLRLLQEIATLKHRKLMETRWMSEDVTTQVSAFEIAARESALEEVNQQIAELEMLATEDSVVTALPSWLRPGVWVNANTVLAELASSHTVEVRAYVPANKVALLKDQNAMFFFNSYGESIELSTRTVGNSNIDVLDDQALAVSSGGEIPVNTNSDGELKPLQGWVLALLAPVENDLTLSNERSGYVMFPAQAKSLISSVLERFYGVVIRESGI